MPVSTELVPISYDRAAWNTLHGTELRAHDDRITPDEARQANNDYTIELELGDHGFPYYLSPDHPEAPPNEVAYQAAADVIDDMEEGDVLFLEAPGSPQGDLNSRDRISSVRRLLRRTIGIADTGPSQEEQRQVLEEGRRNRTISAWTYAMGLASLKGICVVNADIDAFELQSFEALTGGKGLDGIGPRVSDDPSDLRLWKDINAYRNRKVRNVVKDWAIEHPIPEPDTEPSARKPKLVVLIGAGHGPDLQRAVEEVGLQVTAHYMKTEWSPTQQRLVIEGLESLIAHELDILRGLDEP